MREKREKTVPKDVVTPNIMLCSCCGGIVDKYEFLFQCRDCGAMGDFTTGIMTQMNLKPRNELN